MHTTVPERIAALRKAMRAHGVNACLVPSADPHLSEYLPAHWQARQWLSGFDGSAGTLVVSQDFAGLWTDSRYFEQAEQQLKDSGIELMKLRVPHTPEYVEWLQHQFGRGDVLAVAGDTLAVTAQRRLQSKLDKVGAILRCDLDVPGLIWPERPALPCAPITEHSLEYAITTRSEKLQRVRSCMREAGASHHLLSALDDIAWLCNLRGSDVDYNPVFLAHLLIDAERCTLFVDAAKLDDALQRALRADGIALHAYTDATQQLATLPTDASILLDPAHVVTTMSDALPAHVRVIERANPSTAMKAIKSEFALQHIRETMREDGAALVQAFHRLERTLLAGEHVTELDVDSFLLEARAARPGFVSESFATIAGYMANGALPHYRATAQHHATLQRDGLLLVDSGGQYLGGTTDITRVWAFGETTQEQRRDCTAVLQGMIALSRARFPRGASGPQLDALARAPLWAHGADYGHGTGHGVGYFLNVHEGPHGIRPPAPGAALVALEPGMISSIEPGLYKPGRHGIRHENLAVVADVESTEFGDFLRFETLTLCPFDTRALEPAMLDEGERGWLDDYHRQVELALSPLLDKNDREWLHERCMPL